MVGWHHRFNGHEFGQTPGDHEGQGSLVCCSPWGGEELDMTRKLKNTRPWLSFSSIGLVSSHPQFEARIRLQWGRPEFNPWVGKIRWRRDRPPTPVLSLAWRIPLASPVLAGGFFTLSHQGSCCCWVASVVSNSVRPHRRQPTSLPRPWDEPRLQARTLEWVAIAFSNAWEWKVKVKSLSHVWFFETPWTAAYQAPPSMGFSRQEDRSGEPLPSPTRRLLIKGKF